MIGKRVVDKLISGGSADLIATTVFGVVHGLIGSIQHPLQGFVIGIQRGDTETGRYGEVQIVELDPGIGQTRTHALGNLLGTRLRRFG